MAFAVFFTSNLCLALFASVITALIAPAATGSGIPEVKAYLNGVDAPGIFTVRTLFAFTVLGVYLHIVTLFHIDICVSLFII